jgi:hypothetical protein
MATRRATAATCGWPHFTTTSGSFAALVWVLAVLLSLPLTALAGRSVPRTIVGIPSGQFPGQSEEESESWPKSEARHAPQLANGGSRGRSASSDRLRWPLALESANPASRPARVVGHPESLGRNGTGGPLRC